MPNARKYKRRRRKPLRKPRRKVDRIQNKRIKRLEQAPERKFVYSGFAHHSLAGDVAAEQGGALSGQIYPLLPTMDNGTSKNDFIGMSVNLKNINTKVQLTNPTPTSVPVRVIVFWSKAPIAWVAGTSGSNPTGVMATPTWNQLLHNFVNSDTTDSMMVAHRQRVLANNDTPYIFLSDQTYVLGGNALGNIKKFTISKSYKAMKLHYSVGTAPLTSAQATNRQLYMAVLPGKYTSSSPANDPTIDFTSVLTYTDE